MLSQDHTPEEVARRTGVACESTRTVQQLTEKETPSQGSYVFSSTKFQNLSMTSLEISMTLLQSINTELLHAFFYIEVDLIQ